MENIQAFIEWGDRRNRQSNSKHNVIAMSRETFKSVFDVFKDEDDIVFISIEYTPDCAKGGEIEDNEHYAPSSDRVLNLEFDDCSEKELYDGFWMIPIDECRAEKITKFVWNNRDKHVIIHCRAGQSRSQGVFRAIMLELPEYYKEEAINRLNPCVTPNYQVCGLVRRKLRELEMLKTQC